MANFTFSNKPFPNHDNSYKFPTVASTLVQIVKNELQKDTYAGAIALQNVRHNLNSRISEFNSLSDLPNTRGNSSFLSTPLIVNLNLLATPYVNDFGVKVETPFLQLHICLIETNQSNTIVESSPINESGTIKELVSSSDLELSVSGVLVGFFAKPTPNNPLAGKPIEDVKKLNEICNSPVAIEIQSDFLNQFNIADSNGKVKMCIKNLRMPQTESLNIQEFTFTAITNNDDLTIL